MQDFACKYSFATPLHPHVVRPPANVLQKRLWVVSNTTGKIEEEILSVTVAATLVISLKEAQREREDKDVGEGVKA